MSETRARRRIREAVESRGYTLVSLEYEPWYDAGEKAGIGGGWFGTLDRATHPNVFPGDEIMGLSVEETLAWIDEFVPTPEPCECHPETAYPSMSLTPVWCHEPTCRWHLRYCLRWWKAA